AVLCAGEVPKDVSGAHEERKEGVRKSGEPLVVTGEVGEQGPTRCLKHVVGDIEDPKPDNENHDGPYSWSTLVERVAVIITYVSGVSN
ncbi:hypothetical protein LINPERHAP2_LOCUS5249, partial [Linum perenne]